MDLFERGMTFLRFGAILPRRVQLLGSGAALDQMVLAAACLEQDHGVGADVWHVISFAAMAGEGDRQEQAWLQGSRPVVGSWFECQLGPTTGPIIAATDGARAVAELVRGFVPPGRRYLTFGTDGLGRADAASIVQACLRALDETTLADQAEEQHRLADVISLASI